MFFHRAKRAEHVRVVMPVADEAAARKLESEGASDREALKIMNLQCLTCKNVVLS